MSLFKDTMGTGLRALNRLAGSSTVDRLGLRRVAEKSVYGATRVGFLSAGAANRVFRSSGKLLSAQRPSRSVDAGLFDLSVSDEQSLLRDTCSEFAAEQLRPAGFQSDTDCETPHELMSAANGLGLHLLSLPEALGGVGQERSSLTNVLAGTALASGDLSLAVSCLASGSVANALLLWGTGDQQARYLPAFAGENVPRAALAVHEPTALFDPFDLSVKARRSPEGYVLSGIKSLVPNAATCELFLVAAHVEGRGPTLFIVESALAGLGVEPEPAMGLRACATGKLVLNEVEVPVSAMLGEAVSAETYAQCIHLSRIGWCAMAIGCAQAARNYLVDYANQRTAFGEPISHRQSVAFAIAEIAIDLEAMRLLTWRAASQADQGRSFSESAALARRMCADKGVRIGSDAVQLLGGHGFVKEHPVERWYRDLRAAGIVEGVLLV